MLKLLFLFCTMFKSVALRKRIIGVRYSESKQCIAVDCKNLTVYTLFGKWMICSIKSYDTATHVLIEDLNEYHDLIHQLELEVMEELTEILESKFNNIIQKKRFHNGKYVRYEYYKTDIEKIPRAATGGEVLLWNNSMDGIVVYGIANMSVDMDEKLVLHEICKLMDDFHVA